MASEEHKALAQYVKQVHSSLRKASSKLGAEEAWQKHCEDKNVLRQYSECMTKLATVHWANNNSRESNEATSRIQWAADFCYDYFINKSYLQYREKEINIAKKINVTIDEEENFLENIKLIDVGSCYNPFKIFDFLDVLAIDLYPANKSVYKCDFLEVSIGSSNEIISNEVEQLQLSYFDVVTFCFLLEYLPSSQLRLIACEKAYNILKPGGLLVISTPDSKHVGANSKLMKSWRYTLAKLGFLRIKYEKYKHMHCMAFRKSLCKETAVRWADIHEDTYMKYAIHIPQDFIYSDESEEEEEVEIKSEVSTKDFYELPFCEELWQWSDDETK